MAIARDMSAKFKAFSFPVIKSYSVPVFRSSVIPHFPVSPVVTVIIPKLFKIPCDCILIIQVYVK